MQLFKPANSEIYTNGFSQALSMQIRQSFTFCCVFQLLNDNHARIIWSATHYLVPDNLIVMLNIAPFFRVFFRAFSHTFFAKLSNTYHITNLFLALKVKG
jgi:hypothetical protein